MRASARVVFSGFLSWDSCSFSKSIAPKSNRNIKLARNPNAIAAISAEVLSWVETKMIDANKNTHPVPNVM